VIESVALFAPTPAVGLNFTEIVQLPLVAEIELPQVFVWLYESAATPLKLIPLIFSGTGPVLLNVTVCAAVSINVAVLAKLKLVGLTPAAGTPPVPLKLTACGLSAASLEMLSVALFAPTLVGLNFTEIVQLPVVGEIADVHPLFSSMKFVVSLIVTPLTVSGELPLFVTVILCAALASSTR
jgi:hypothetical protein